MLWVRMPRGAENYYGDRSCAVRRKRGNVLLVHDFVKILSEQDPQTYQPVSHLAAVLCCLSTAESFKSLPRLGHTVRTRQISIYTAADCQLIGTVTTPPAAWA